MSKITTTNIRKILIILCLGFSINPLMAQESGGIEGFISKFSVQGSVDTYFRTNFNGLNKFEYDENENILGSPQAPATSFANDPGFALGMANVILGYEGEKVGFVADLVIGPRGEDAVFLSGPSTNLVNQLYVYYNVSEKLTLTLGNFNTFLGYEVISPVGNFNYSSSYMFSYGPFSHTGLKADFSFSDNWSGMLAIMNPTDWTEFDPFGLYSFGGQLGYSTDLGSAFLNVLYGEQAPNTTATFQIDLTTGWDLTSVFYLGLNTTYSSNGEGFYAAALYPQFKTSENFAIGLRAEYFEEMVDGGPVYGAGIKTYDFTLTGNYKIGGLTIKPELRLDSVSEDVFVNANLVPTNKLSSFILAAVYAF
ncbi:MAG: porin [Gillisia sp.]